MGAYVLLNLLKELRKRYKMRGLLSILFLFRRDFIQFNNTGARMLDSSYHMKFKITTFRRENVKILPCFTQRYERHYVTLLKTNVNTRGVQYVMKNPLITPSKNALRPPHT